MKLDIKTVVDEIDLENDFRIMKEEIEVLIFFMKTIQERRKTENRMNEFLYNLVDYRVKRKNTCEFINTKLKVVDSHTMCNFFFI